MLVFALLSIICLTCLRKISHQHHGSSVEFEKKLFSFIDRDCPPRLILPVLGKTNRHKFSVLYSSISNISFPRGFTNGKGQGEGWTVLSPKRQWQGWGWTVPGHCNLCLILWWDVTSKWRKRDFLVGCRAATAGVRDHCWPMQKIKVCTQHECRGLSAEGCQMCISQDVQYFTVQETDNSPWNYTGLHLDPHIAPLQLETALEENWL